MADIAEVVRALLAGDKPVQRLTDAEIDTHNTHTGRTLRAITALINPERFSEVQKTWPMSLNIEDRRNEPPQKLELRRLLNGDVVDLAGNKMEEK